MDQTNRFIKPLSGGDLRSIGNSNSIVLKINNQTEFDELFKCLFHKDRLVVMRAADAIEKITISNPQYLAKHKKKIIVLLNTAKDKELKWHLASIAPRLQLDKNLFLNVWSTLTCWAKDKTNSRIVRVCAAQGLFEMAKQDKSLLKDFKLDLSELEKENIPSLNARIRKIRKSD